MKEQKPGGILKNTWKFWPKSTTEGDGRDDQPPTVSLKGGGKEGFPLERYCVDDAEGEGAKKPSY